MMRAKDQRPLLYDLPLMELTQRFKDSGLSPFIAKQIFNWVYKKMSVDTLEWSNVSAVVKAFLTETFDFSLPKVLWSGLSADGTRKFLLQLADGKNIESVVIFSRNRMTQCLSTQVGCAIGCKFCHTGTQGLQRNMSAGEIIGQYLAVARWMKENAGPEEKITNLVYMGQGEPLHNFEQVKRATEIFLTELGIGFGQRRITLSTSGLVPQIEKLKEFPPVNIAISLHSAKNEIRSELMPINKVYDLERLFAAIKTIPLKAHRRITYEYLLIDNLNNGAEDIDALEKLIPKKESKINLIPFNEYPASHFKRPSAKNIQWFCDELNGRGFTCTIRATKGSDILAACGQLKSKIEEKLASN